MPMAFSRSVISAVLGVPAKSWLDATTGTRLARAASMQEVACDDAVLLLGEDVTNGAPMLGLALRQAVLRQPYREAATLQALAGRWDDYLDAAGTIGLDLGNDVWLLPRGLEERHDRTTRAAAFMRKEKK